MAGKQWIGKGYANTAYTSDRLYIYPFPDEYKAPHQDLIETLADGDFEVIPPTETGSDLDQLPQYLAAKKTCSALPVSFWNGTRQITQSEYNQRIYESVAPYVPNRPRPVDYELHYKGDLTPYASATDDLTFYDLGQSGQDGKLAIFGAKKYAPLPSREPKGFPLERQLCRVRVATLLFYRDRRLFHPLSSPTRDTVLATRSKSNRGGHSTQRAAICCDSPAHALRSLIQSTL